MNFIEIALGMRSATLNFGGGGGSSGPTVQQQQLQTQQALTTANLNLEENAQRKSMLDSMMGTRVFRGSALSRATRGNAPGTGDPAGAPSATQLSTSSSPVTPNGQSLVDVRDSRASGATPSGGTGASVSSGAVSVATGGYQGGGNSRSPGRLQA